MKNTRLILLFLMPILLITCTTKLSEDKNLEQLGLNAYLNNNIIVSLDNCIKDFEIFLKNNYKDVPKKQRIKKFLSEYSRAYTSDEINNMLSLVDSFNFFINDVQLLKKNGFFNTKSEIDNDIVIANAQKWYYSLLFDKKKYNIDSIVKKDNLKRFNFRNNGVGIDYYFGLYKIAPEQNTLTKKWIESRIITGSSIPAITYINTLPNNYLNSTLSKSLIFIEFILPFYNHEKQKFELVPTVPRSVGVITI